MDLKTIFFVLVIINTIGLYLINNEFEKYKEALFELDQRADALQTALNGIVKLYGLLDDDGR